MNQRFIGLLLLLLLACLLITGCETGGKLKIFNRTSYPVYAGIHGELYTIGADSSFVLEFATPTESIFNPDTGLDVDMYLAGETYQIWDAFLEAYVDSAFVRINTGETTRVYVDPNRAGIKVINQSQQYIKRIIVQKNTLSTSTTFSYDVFMAPGDVWQKPVQPATNTDSFFYIVQIVFENDTIFSYGNTQNILYVDEQFLVTVLQP